ncbi:protein-export chaperone SecB [Burkholderia cenocepacia]|uniref:protein-export chaperone SecB n=1 Tax=Burkholderia cenocepacia TaxID=95486 RepID=UPI00076D249A|nr:protein-export chaperone SecB [Burkholderia cenocepacia]KWU17863.1 hypothetical protein AS149_14185 [Burkholderia cenocepacia]
MTQPTLALQGIFLRRSNLNVERMPYQIQADSGSIHYNVDVNYLAKPLNNEGLHAVECKAQLSANWGEQAVMVGEFIFELVIEAKGFDDVSLAQVLGGFCPNQVTPYLRHWCQTMTQATGFQPLILPPFIAPANAPQSGEGKVALPAEEQPAALPDYSPRKLH